MNIPSHIRPPVPTSTVSHSGCIALPDAVANTTNIDYTGPPPVEESELPEFDQDLARLLREVQCETDTYHECLRALAGISTDDTIAEGSGLATSQPVHRPPTPIHYSTPRALPPPPRGIENIKPRITSCPNQSLQASLQQLQKTAT
ncbi:hypothetical protein RSAG8_03560, partial [Rhizoctonia solani AG-8 WAC10335]